MVAARCRAWFWALWPEERSPSPGAAYQGTFRNPLADPYLLGAAAGAELGATLAITSCPGEPCWASTSSPWPRSSERRSRSPGAYVARARSAGGLRSVDLADPGRGRDRVVPDRDPDLRPATERRPDPAGVRLAPRPAPDRGLAGRARSCCRTSRSAPSSSSPTGGVLDILQFGDDEAASLGVRPRRVRFWVVVAATLGTAAVGRRLRSDRVRRHHRAAHGAAHGRPELSRGRAAVAAARGGVPRPRRHVGPRGGGAGRAADRRDHRVDRRAVLRRRASIDPDDDVIRLEHVSIGYGEAPVVRDVSVVVPSGGWSTLIGPNGAGKSSVLRAVAGLVAHDGSIALGGVATHDLAPRELARRVAMVPQEPEVPPGMTVAEYVAARAGPRTCRTSAKEGARDRPVAGDVIERLAARAVASRERWGGSAAASGARRDRKGPGATGAHPVARRAHHRARRRPAAGGAGSDRRPADARRADRLRRDARPDAWRGNTPMSSC